VDALLFSGVTSNDVGTNPLGQAVAGFTADPHVNRKDSGLNWNMALEAGDSMVGDDIKIKIEIELEAVSEDPACVANYIEPAPLLNGNNKVTVYYAG
jgi:hypothetical protein